MRSWPSAPARAAEGVPGPGLATFTRPVSFRYMQIRVVLLASYRDLAGAAELFVELPPDARATDAIAVLRGRSTRAALLPERPVIAVNQEYASLDIPLHDGDELALLPPVAGG